MKLDRQSKASETQPAVACSPETFPPFPPVHLSLWAKAQHSDSPGTRCDGAPWRAQRGKHCGTWEVGCTSSSSQADSRNGVRPWANLIWEPSWSCHILNSYHSPLISSHHYCAARFSLLTPQTLALRLTVRTCRRVQPEPRGWPCTWNTSVRRITTCVFPNSISQMFHIVSKHVKLTFRSKMIKLSIYLSVCLSIYLSIYLSIHLSIYLHLYLYLYLSLSLSISISISIYLSLSLSLSIYLSIMYIICIHVCIYIYTLHRYCIYIYIIIWYIYIFFTINFHHPKHLGSTWTTAAPPGNEAGPAACSTSNRAGLSATAPQPHRPYGGFHHWGIPQNGWFIMEHPKITGFVFLGLPPFMESSI